MNFRVASFLLATMATATASTTSSKAYRLFTPRPKAGKASDSADSVSEGSLVTVKSSKTFSLSSSLLLSPKTAKKSKMVKSIKAAKCIIDQSVSMSMSTTDVVRRVLHGNVTHSVSLSMDSKSAKSKVAKCLPMSVSMSIETAMPTYYPTYSPTGRRPIQRMVCQSGDFVDSQGNDCFWYEEPNIELGCESLRNGTDLSVGGKTPWDECCFCGGGTMVPENTTVARNLEVVDEGNDVIQEKMGVASTPGDLEGAHGDTNSIVCISGRDFVDPLGRDCSFYVPENIEQGCGSLRGHGDMVNEFSWNNEEGLTPWSECCFCGGGTLGYESSA
eukprot:scaffold2532_cov79-Skeletonema_menzelii.AAC.31